MLWALFFWSLPWLGAYVVVLVRDPARLPGGLSDRGIGAPPPFVSVIVPGRNEAHNITACVGPLISPGRAVGSLDFHA